MYTCMNFFCLCAGVFVDWRWLAICCSIPPTLLMVCMCFMPETPRFLLSKGRRHEAEEALRFLRGPDAPVEWERSRIESTCEEQVSSWLRVVRSTESNQPKTEACLTTAPFSSMQMLNIWSKYQNCSCLWSSLQPRQGCCLLNWSWLWSSCFFCQGSSFQMSDLKDPGVYKPLVIGIMLMVFQQMSGINAIMFYAETIFEEAHFKVRRFKIVMYSGEIATDSTFYSLTVTFWHTCWMWMLYYFLGERPSFSDCRSDSGRLHSSSSAYHGQGWKEGPSHHLRYLQANSYLNQVFYYLKKSSGGRSGVLRVWVGYMLFTVSVNSGVRFWNEIISSVLFSFC